MLPKTMFTPITATAMMALFFMALGIWRTSWLIMPRDAPRLS